MFERLDELAAELEKLEADLPAIMASGDRVASRDAGRRHAELKPIVDVYREYRATEQELVDARELLADERRSGDGGDEMRDFLADEVAAKERELDQLEAVLR